MKAKFQQCIFLLILSTSIVCAQKSITINGYVSDASSGERLIGAVVFDMLSGQGTVTNTFGFYSLTLKNADSIYLKCSYVGFNPTTILFTDSKNVIEHSFNLQDNIKLQEVIVTADKHERIEQRAQMGQIDVPIEQIKNIPAIMGERDVLKALQLLPGVSGGGEGQSGIYVRGGGPDQNLILLDGVPVYNASHLFGFFSTFNADAIKDVSLIKGGFPARYGGRLSSVIDITMKEGNDKEFHGEGGIGIIASRLTLEGPIKKEKSSFIVSARRTYIDILARPLIQASLKEEGATGDIGYFFDDINAKVNYKLSSRDRLYLSFYTGRDKFNFDYNEKFTNSESQFGNDLVWGNITSAMRWNHVINPKTFANTTFTYSRFRFKTGTSGAEIENGPPKTSETFDLTYNSGINDVALKLDFDYLPNPLHIVKFGASVIYHTFNPGKFITSFKPADEPKATTSTIGQPKVYGTETSLYAEDDWKITDNLRLNTGLHLAGFFVKQKSYVSLQPRMNARYLLSNGWAVKAAFSSMQQNVHLLTNETIGLPFDLWLPSTSKVKPQFSWQPAIGLAKTIKSDYEFSTEIYYKRMKNIIVFKDGASLFQFNNWEERIEQGVGNSYGIEFFVQKKKGKLTGWVGYTLSKTDRQFASVNQGRVYPYRYDRRHDFEIVATYKFTKKFQISATWVYATGNAVTLAPTKRAKVEEYYIDIVEVTKDRNNFRMPSYHRLDFSLDFIKTKKKFSRTISLGAYNAYSRANPFFLFLDTDYTYKPDGSYTKKEVLKQAALFPIIPSLTYSFKF